MQRLRRPAWERRTRFWLTDGVDDRRPSFGDLKFSKPPTLFGRVLDVIDPECERWERWVTRPLLRLDCAVWGHATVNDQCRKPEHRYCAVCGAGRANERLDDERR